MELETILMIDDDDSIRRIAELTLTGFAKFQVTLAKSGLDGLKILETQTPDLIILDVMMPGMDGPTVLNKLKENPATASIPVAFMTAKVQKHEMAAYAKMGADGVIIKPFEPSELPGQLRDIYGQAKSKAAPLAS